MTDAKEIAGQIEYYPRAMKAPHIREAAAWLADQARQAGWTHEEYLSVVLSREVAAREASGAELRAWAAGFPARKSLEDFSFDPAHNSTSADKSPLFRVSKKSARLNMPEPVRASRDPTGRRTSVCGRIQKHT